MPVQPLSDAHAPSTAPTERLVFSNTVEGLFRERLREQLTPVAHQALKEVGLDLSGRLLPAYPVEVWKRALEVTVRYVYPELDTGAGFQQLGRRVVEGVGETVLGRAMVGMARLLGPLRALRRLPLNLRNADNYVEARFTEVSPTCCTLFINEVLEQPRYYQGILEACAEMAGARNVRVALVAREGAGATYRVEWDA